jgi:hypothetical protein
MWCDEPGNLRDPAGTRNPEMSDKFARCTYGDKASQPPYVVEKDLVQSSGVEFLVAKRANHNRDVFEEYEKDSMLGEHFDFEKIIDVDFVHQRRPHCS